MKRLSKQEIFDIVCDKICMQDNKLLITEINFNSSCFRYNGEYCPIGIFLPEKYFTGNNIPENLYEWIQENINSKEYESDFGHIRDNFEFLLSLDNTFCIHQEDVLTRIVAFSKQHKVTATDKLKNILILE